MANICCFKSTDAGITDPRLKRHIDTEISMFRIWLAWSLYAQRKGLVSRPLYNFPSRKGAVDMLNSVQWIVNDQIMFSRK